jgi:peptide chain release factor 1
MLDKLKQAHARSEELERLLGQPDTVADRTQFARLNKEYRDLLPLAQKYREYERLAEDLQQAHDILESSSEKELLELARSEVADLEKKKAELEENLRGMLLPRDPRDDKNALMEIRAGTGGEEAALFAAELYRMYSRFIDGRGWKTEVMTSNPTELGGFKEIVFLVSGQGVYGALRSESGTHRVQRVPVTEAGGRIHTSAVTVAVLPDVEEVELNIDPKDLEIDIFRASGPGGQNVQKVETAVRITHLPTGIVASCQDERSQQKNRLKAMKILRARLLDRMQREQEEAIARERRQQVGSGDRSEKIRTYNFPQNRVTDHRIGLTLHSLDRVMEGDLEELVRRLVLARQEQLLHSSGMEGSVDT